MMKKQLSSIVEMTRIKHIFLISKSTSLAQDVAGINVTHIFSNQNGFWKESITLEESYESYGLSGRNLITMKYNDISGVHEFNSFNIEDCMQEMPTSSPSLSIAPTSCYSVKITIQYDYFARQISFELEQISLAGDDYMIKTHQAGTEDFYNESICLQKGEYKFTIYDSGGNGMFDQRRDHGSYNVTMSHGELIAEGGGGDFSHSQTTIFTISEGGHISHSETTSSTSVWEVSSQTPSMSPLPS